MKTLNICYYQRDGEEADAFTFVGEATEKEALKYARDYSFWPVEADDIKDVFKIETEEDATGKNYKITIKEIK